MSSISFQTDAKSAMDGGEIKLTVLMMIMMMTMMIMRMAIKDVAVDPVAIIEM
jgi:hypothetical protein